MGENPSPEFEIINCKIEAIVPFEPIPQKVSTGIFLRVDSKF